MNFEKFIPKAIPLKRKEEHKDMHPEYTQGLQIDALNTSKKFREKVEADRKRLGLS